MKIEVREKLNSCKVTINAKGRFSGEVKVYEETATAAFEKATEHANMLEGYLKEKNGEIGDS